MDMPLTLHINTAPDDKTVQAAMYGPVVLAALLGTEGLTTSMIYGGSGPRGFDDGYPMPEVDMRHRMSHRAKAEAPSPPNHDSVWFERAEASPFYSLRFHTRGRGPGHALVPLNQVMDDRYSVYLRHIDTA